MPRVPDAGSRAWSLRAGWAAAILVAVVAVMQRWPEPPAEAPAAGSAAVVAAAPQADLTGRFVVKVAAALRSMSPGMPVRELTSNMDMVARASGRSADFVRAAIVAAELWRVEGEPGAGRMAAESRLAEAERRLRFEPRREDREALERDIATLRTVYGSADDATLRSALPEEARRALVERYGFYGRLALAYHLPAQASERAALLSGGRGLLLLSGAFVGGAGLAGLAGLVLLVVGLAAAWSGRLRRAFVPPAPGGSAHVEAFAIFLAGFVGLSAAGELLPEGLRARAGPMLLLGHWLLALVPLWVVARGTPWREALQQMGLHRGRGVWREACAGIGAYVAGLPLVFLSVLAALALVMVQNWVMGTPDAPPRNPLLERLARGDAVYLAVLFFMATAWAPLVEETVFRGCLYRHLSSRLGMAGAGVVSAAAFGLVHGVPLPLTLPLMTLGFVFAFTRHWRDSLIGAMTAHALHNATVLTFALSMLSLLRD